MYMLTAKKWNVADLARLPNDGNRYEVVNGELFVTPAASIGHQRLVQAIWMKIDPYVRAHDLGEAFCTGGDVHLGRSSLVIPDVMVLPTAGGRARSWKAARRPTLVVECTSRSTAQRDWGAKRDLYRHWRIPEYWIADSAERSVTVVRPDLDDQEFHSGLTWFPAGAAEPLSIDLPSLFRAAIDG